MAGSGAGLFRRSRYLVGGISSSGCCARCHSSTLGTSEVRSSNLFPPICSATVWNVQGVACVPGSAIASSNSSRWVALRSCSGLTLSSDLPFTTHTVPPGRISPDSGWSEKTSVLTARLLASLLGVLCPPVKD